MLPGNQLQPHLLLEQSNSGIVYLFHGNMAPGEIPVRHGGGHIVRQAVDGSGEILRIKAVHGVSPPAMTVYRDLIRCDIARLGRRYGCFHQPKCGRSSLRHLRDLNEQVADRGNGSLGIMDMAHAIFKQVRRSTILS
jgi:hypothetical protein